MKTASSALPNRSAEAEGVTEPNADTAVRTKGPKTVLHDCAGCNTRFEIVKKEITRARQPVNGHFCSKECRSHRTNRLGRVDSVGLWLKEAWLQEAYADAHRNARKGAVKREIEFNYSKEDYNAAIRACNNRCAISGIEFENSARTTKFDRRPFIPSIDRIDSTKGYTKDNIRIVCSAANLAMNTGGDAPLTRLAINMVAKLHNMTAATLMGKLSTDDSRVDRIRELELRNQELESRLAAQATAV